MRIGRVLVVVAVVLLAGGVAARLVAGEPEDYSKRPDRIASQGWATPLPNPVLKAGDLRHQALWNDPSVLKEDGRYVMYMTTSVDEPFKPPILPFRAVSPDGITWKLDPETPVAEAKGTRFVSVETPSVVKFQGEYHMFFSGIYPAGGPAMMAIGHAVSADGVHWQVSPDPVISSTGHPSDWNGVLVGEPGAIVRGDEIFVYFSAVGARASGHPPQYQTIGLAKTRDGEHFTPSMKVLEQGSVYPPDKGFAGYTCPQPFELNGKVHLLYVVALDLPNARPEWQQVALHHAVSLTDGQGDFVQDDKPIFTRNDFPWTMGEVDGPTALVDDGQVKLWFGGHVPVSALGPLVQHDFSGPDFGIDFATRSVADFQ
jgi:predicted GH43/DUF377 family glycosyl hydrolase